MARISPRTSSRRKSSLGVAQSSSAVIGFDPTLISILGPILPPYTSTMQAPRREGASPTWTDALWALRCAIVQRCPQCRKGALFTSPWSLTLHERCPVCGLKFDRGNGYFTGAWAINIVVAEVVATAIWLPLAVGTTMSVDAVTAVGVGASIGLPVLGFRPCRAFWIALDRLLNPVS